MVKELLKGTLNPTEGKSVFDVAREVATRQRKQIQRVKNEEKKTDEKNVLMSSAICLGSEVTFPPAP